MIFFIDEDRLQLEAFVIEIKIRGYEVTFIQDADTAFEILSKVDASGVEAVIVDIMLATRRKTETRFDPYVTADFMKTGVALIEEVIKSNALLKSKIAIFTGATTDDILSRVREVGNSQKIPVYRKKDFISPKKFFDEILAPKVGGKEADGTTGASESGR